MGNFVENVKWGGVRYAIDTAKNARDLDITLQRLKQPGIVPIIDPEDALDAIKQGAERISKDIETISETADKVLRTVESVYRIYEIVNKFAIK